MSSLNSGESKASRVYIDGSAEAEARRERIDNARLAGWSNAPDEGEGKASRNHEKVAMEVDGRDYVTYRLGGKRCHHKIRFVCLECGATKSYFENLMGYRGNPTCDGITQKLSTSQSREGSKQ